MPTIHGADGQHDGGDVTLAEAKLAALEILTDVLQWRLTQDHWERVTKIVQIH